MMEMVAGAQSGRCAIMDYRKRVNQFNWPGFNLHPLPGQNDTFAYDFIPSRLYEAVKAPLLETHWKPTKNALYGSFHETDLWNTHTHSGIRHIAICSHYY